MKMPPVSCRYGAPMGRRTNPHLNPAEPVRLFRVRITSDGYDGGGAYWGLGQPLYCATQAAGPGDLGDEFTQYYRARDRAHAAAKLCTEHPKAKLARPV